MSTRRVALDKADASLIAAALDAEARKAVKDGFTDSADRYSALAAKMWKVVDGLGRTG